MNISAKLNLYHTKPKLILYQDTNSATLLTYQKKTSQNIFIYSSNTIQFKTKLQCNSFLNNIEYFVFHSVIIFPAAGHHLTAPLVASLTSLQHKPAQSRLLPPALLLTSSEQIDNRSCSAEGRLSKTTSAMILELWPALPRAVASSL